MRVKFYKAIKFTAILFPLLWGIGCLLLNRTAAAVTSFLTAGIILLFTLLHKKFSLLKPITFCAVILFVLFSHFAGKALHFYSFVPHWDKILHLLSGFLLYSIGRQIGTRLQKSDAQSILLLVFAFLFSVACAGIWELYEFAGDTLFGLHAQNNSLSDTMLDMLFGSIGAILMLTINFRQYKNPIQ